jgi:hypothetical protein
MRYWVLSALLCACGSRTGASDIASADDNGSGDADGFGGASSSAGTGGTVDANARSTPPTARSDASADADGGERCDVTGASRCSGRQFQACNASKIWQTTATCAFVCADGACTGVCLPGDQQCMGGRISQICNDAGAWTAGGAICQPGSPLDAAVRDAPPVVDAARGSDAGQSGDARADATLADTTASSDSRDVGIDACVNPFVPGAACEPTCVPGTKRCDGSYIETCDALGSWAGPQFCQWGCGGGICLDCPNGAIQCNGTLVQVCQNITWVDLPGDTRCLDGGSGDAETD